MTVFAKTKKPLGNRPIEPNSAQTGKTKAAEKKSLGEPFDPNKWERRAEIHEELARKDTDPNLKKYSTEKAKTIRRMLGRMEQIGWIRKDKTGEWRNSTSSIDTATGKEYIEVR